MRERKIRLAVNSVFSTRRGMESREGSSPVGRPLLSFSTPLPTVPLGKRRYPDSFRGPVPPNNLESSMNNDDMSELKSLRKRVLDLRGFL